MGWKNEFCAGLLVASALLSTGCNRQEGTRGDGYTSGEYSVDPLPERDPELEEELLPEQFTEMALAPIGLDAFELDYVDAPFYFDSSTGPLYVATIEFNATWDEIAAKVEEHRVDSGTRISVEESVLVFEHENNWYSLTQYSGEDGRTYVNIQFSAGHE